MLAQYPTITCVQKWFSRAVTASMGRATFTMAKRYEAKKTGVQTQLGCQSYNQEPSRLVRVKKVDQFDDVWWDQGGNKASRGLAHCFPLQGQVVDQGILQQLWKSQVHGLGSQAEGDLAGLCNAAVEWQEGVPTKVIRFQKEKSPVKVNAPPGAGAQRLTIVQGNGSPGKSRCWRACKQNSTSLLSKSIRPYHTPHWLASRR